MEHANMPRWFKSTVTFPTLNPDRKNKFDYDFPFPDYLKTTDAISSSGLKNVLQSPRHYLADLMGLEKDEDDEKDHFRFGRAAHMMILEPARFKELYVVEPVFTGKTKDGRDSSQSKEARDAKAAWYANLSPDALVVTAQEMEDLTNMVDSLMEHDQASNLLKNGRPEVTGFFTDEETGIRCKIRPDYLTWHKDGSIYISDIKTTRSSSVGLFSEDAARMKYHMQLAFYWDGVKAITGQEPGAAAFIALEKKIPYSCAVYWLNEEDLEKGRQWYKFALMTLKKCLETGDWPGVQRSAQMINLPKWTEYELFPQFDFKNGSIL